MPMEQQGGRLLPLELVLQRVKNKNEAMIILELDMKTELLSQLLEAADAQREAACGPAGALTGELAASGKHAVYAALPLVRQALADQHGALAVLTRKADELVNAIRALCFSMTHYADVNTSISRELEADERCRELAKDKAALAQIEQQVVLRADELCKTATKKLVHAEPAETPAAQPMSAATNAVQTHSQQLGSGVALCQAPAASAVPQPATSLLRGAYTHAPAPPLQPALATCMPLLQLASAPRQLLPQTAAYVLPATAVGAARYFLVGSTAPLAALPPHAVVQQAAAAPASNPATAPGARAHCAMGGRLFPPSLPANLSSAAASGPAAPACMHAYTPPPPSAAVPSRVLNAQLPAGGAAGGVCCGALPTPFAAVTTPLAGAAGYTWVSLPTAGSGSGALPGYSSGALPGYSSGALPGYGSGALPGYGSGVLPGYGSGALLLPPTQRMVFVQQGCAPVGLGAGPLLVSAGGAHSGGHAAAAMPAPAPPLLHPSHRGGEVRQAASAWGCNAAAHGTQAAGQEQRPDPHVVTSANAALRGDAAPSSSTEGSDPAAAKQLLCGSSASGAACERADATALAHGTCDVPPGGLNPSSSFAHAPTACAAGGRGGDQAASLDNAATPSATPSSQEQSAGALAAAAALLYDSQRGSNSPTKRTAPARLTGHKHRLDDAGALDDGSGVKPAAPAGGSDGVTPTSKRPALTAMRVLTHGSGSGSPSNASGGEADGGQGGHGPSTQPSQATYNSAPCRRGGDSDAGVAPAACVSPAMTEVLAPASQEDTAGGGKALAAGCGGGALAGGGPAVPSMLAGGGPGPGCGPGEGAGRCGGGQRSPAASELSLDGWRGTRAGVARPSVATGGNA